MNSTPALTVEGLAVEYPGRWRRPPARVIHDVSFSVDKHETLALVGESGSGKSTIGKAILGLTAATEGAIRLNGREITHLSTRGRRAIAGELQAIFQNPYGSLNPALTIGQSLAEPILAVRGGSAKQARAASLEVLERVGMPGDTLDRFPGDFSGGQRQRICIARAAVLRPSVIICDEPTSALDVTTQAKVLELLKELQVTLGVAYLFITHDLAVVREFAHRTIVLNKGYLVEEGLTSDVCSRPRDAYTRELLQSAPVPNPAIQRERRAQRRAAALAE
ncbi:MAG TPA: ABC transporter ATP-binding protein [Microbacterium sp.]|uniref:ABC transporter ATP-binding protein n=1 Tax=Microbacterium sp. TaxID=51671 RepID=UPI002B6246A7|nr:ABC transporter ATP-binding protein [Microbacterium sp.]HWI31984.1 ABC transporter ATP-binding protein [Microbacterium sp.]